MKGRALVAYGIGELPITITMTLFGLFVLFFYNSVMKLPGSLAGIATAAGLAIDAIVDPYIGFRSDASLHPLGRRHVFMLWGAVLMGPCFWFLLSPPKSLSQTLLFAWLLGWTILFRFTSALYRIPYLSLGAEMSSDYHERTRIVGIRSLFGVLGTVLAGALSFVVFFPNRVPGVDPKLNYDGYPPMGFVFGCLLTLSGLAGCAGTRQYRSWRSGDAKPAGVAGFFQGFARSLAGRDFRSIWLSFTLFYLAVVFTTSLAIHYFTWYVRIRDSRTISVLQGAFYLGAVGGVLLWMALSKRFEKRPLYLIATLALGIMMISATLAVGDGHVFGTGNPWPLAIGNLVAGVAASALWVLPASMIADAADAEDLRAGERREGIYFGILNFGEKIAAGISLLLSGFLLEAYVKLPAAGDPGVAGAARIGMLYGLLPGTLVALAALFVLGYRLDKAEVFSVQQALGARGTAK